MKCLPVLIAVFVNLTFYGQTEAINIMAHNLKSGIYKTFSDYNKGKLSYEANCETEMEDIKLDEFLREDYIVLKRKGVKIKLKKDGIYGILVCDEPLIRFQDNKQFHLIEKGSLWIYYSMVDEINSSGYKTENPYHYSESKKYYFSCKGDGKLLPLTADNVKEALPEKHAKHSIIDTRFQNIDISEYDTIHKTFLINRVIYVANNSYACLIHPDIVGKEGDKCSKCNKKLEKIKQD
jgi:uncharacterized protein with PIN domain